MEIGGSFKPAQAQTISGFEQVEKREFNIIIGRGGSINLYAECANPGDYIYYEGGPGSQGFGGATLEFKLTKGRGTISLVGPWHSNSSALFTETGLDLRAKHLTFGVISREHTSYYPKEMKDLVYFDEEPTVGEYDRIRKLAEAMSNERGEVLYYWMRSASGGSSGSVNWDKFGPKAD